MNESLARDLLSAKPKSVPALLGSEGLLWVDWREEDDSIPESCERVLNSGDLRSEWRGEDLFVQFRGREVRVPLTNSPDDRHITVLALNQVLRPEAELRYVWASHGSDSAAFLPLAPGQWRALENEFGARAVAAVFMVLQQTPNVFTDSLRPPRKRWWRV